MSRLTDRFALGFAAALCSLLPLASSCSQAPTPSVLASTAQPEEPEPVAVTVFTEQVQLFMEYPRLVPGAEARFLAHVTVLATGEPVRSGQLRIELFDEANQPLVLEASQPERDGLFIPVYSFQKPGTYRASIVVTSPQVNATIPLEPLVVHADLAAALAAAHADEAPEPSNAVPFLLEQQWKIGLLMQRVSPRTMTQRLQVPGEIEAPPYGRAMVSAPLAGVLMPPPSGRFPRLGDQVEKGEILAMLEATLSASDRAQSVANRMAQDQLEMSLLIQTYDLEAKALEVDGQLLQAEARSKFAKWALVRISELHGKGLSTDAEFEAAHMEVELSTQTVKGSKTLKDSFTQSRAQLDTLKSRSAFSATRPPSNRVFLIAPIAGEIVEANYIEGELIAAHDPVFQLLDLNKIWITTHVSEFDLGQLDAAPGALMQLSAYPDKTFNLLDELEGELISDGPIVDPETRTIAMGYEANNPGNLLRAGMFADVFLETKTKVDAIAIPMEAIVMDNGSPVAFVLIHGELFQKRALELGIRDGEFVEVLSGIEAGERVVTDGAYLVKLASASPAAFGAGHAH